MTGATNVDAVYNLRVKVCDSTAGLESNCNVSTNKPEGLLQHYARQMRFGLFSYAMQGNSDINRDGGVLRSNMKWISNKVPYGLKYHNSGVTIVDCTDANGCTNPEAEINTDGSFISNPEAVAGGNSGIINYINKFGYANGYKSYDPISEMYYEIVRYFKNLGPSTDNYCSGLTTATDDGFKLFCGTYNGQNWFRPGDSEKTIGSPGSSNKVICIGSYVTKDHWVDINGITQYQPGNPIVGAISSFSSIGPTRDGRLKPDLVAPGEVIVAAYSSFLTQTPSTNILQGGKHQKMQGTSMASPHVTGVVALMLEKNGALNYDQAVTLLKNTTKKDSYTGTSPNNIYGNGKLDAYNAFLNTPGGGGTQITLMQEGFEGNFPPNGWTQQINNSSNTWSKGNVQNHNFNTIDPTSLNSAFCPWVAQNQNEWLITPPFNLGSGSASIEFYAGYSTQWLSAATIKLHISTNGGVNWNQLWTADNDGQPWSWRNKVIDLSSYANTQNIKLGWQYIGNDGDIVALDGVKLLGGATDVENNNTVITEYTLSQNYPNPFNPITS
ncbi:MAG: S8 family serine peptidase, partial [Clostridiales bacterium]|nr:S8 family serine peptidase [Clostridiales bacterium]